MGYEVDERDMKFILHEQIKIEKLLELPAYKNLSLEELDLMLTEAAKFAKNVLDPLNKPSDEEGAKFADGKVSMPEGYQSAWNQLCEGGWVGLSGDPEYGGLGLPVTLRIASNEYFTGACCAFSLTAGLTTSNANVIANFGSEEAKKLFCEKLYSGQWSGTMCLTEPGAGSDVGANKAQAVKVEGTEDRYRITGTKSFITSGEHDLTENIIHLVLARTPDAPPGTRGISLFIIPKYRVKADGSLGEFNDTVCTNIEHKMGIHGSPTCTLNFGDEGKCEAILVGELNRGIVYMFQMMNEERIAVGLQGVALASASYLSAREYAKVRIQGPHVTRMKDKTAPKVEIIQHPDVRRMLLEMKALAEGCRALLLTTAFYEDMARSDDPETAELYQGYVELLTPICKAYASDMGLHVCDLGVQVLGGYGFCSEYPQEQYMRDVKISSIYEGTNGIQALDLLGRKIAIKGGILFMNYIKKLNDFISEYKDHAYLGKYMAELEAANNLLTEITMYFQQKSTGGDPIYPVLNATPYLRLFSEVVVGQLLLEQALIAYDKLQPYWEKAGVKGDVEGQKKLAEDNDEVKFYWGKLQSTKYFITQILPDAEARAKSMKSDDISPLEIVF
jgi:alkylation response protein AidB-like acyl-CoA dehydrogenase